MNSIFLLVAIISGGQDEAVERSVVVSFEVKLKSAAPLTGTKTIKVDGQEAKYIGVIDRQAEKKQSVENGWIVDPPKPGYPLEFYETSAGELYIFRDAGVPTFKIDKSLVNPDHLNALKDEVKGNEGRNISTFFLDKDGNVIGPGNIIVIEGSNSRRENNTAGAVTASAATLQELSAYSYSSQTPPVYNIRSRDFDRKLAAFSPSDVRQKELISKLRETFSQFPEFYIENFQLTNKLTGTSISVRSVEPRPVIAEPVRVVVKDQFLQAAGVGR